MKIKKYPALFLLAFGPFLGGCATTSPLMVPVRPSPMHSIDALPVARFRIPVVVPLPNMRDVEKHVSEFVKDDLKKAEKSLVKSLGTTFWVEPMEWEFNGNSLTAHAHVHYKRVPGDKPAGAKGASPETAVQEVEKDLKLDMASAVQWTKNFHLEAPDFDEGNSLNATAEDEEEEAVKSRKILKKGTTRIHESLKQRTLGMEEKAKELWMKIQEPFRMAEDIWLHIQPNRISVGDVRLVPDPKNPRLETVFEFYVQPDISIGEKPKVKVVEMPPLEDYQPGPEGFHIATNLKISFKEVNKLLVDPKLGILRKALPGGGDRHIQIDDMLIYGSGGKLVVEAQVEYQPLLNLSSKPAQLTIYLLGTPVYHEDKQEIDFPDMDFDIKTSDFLVQMADFIMGSGMREKLRKEAVIPVGKDLAKLKVEMEKVLNRPLGRFAKLNTEVTNLKMTEAFVSDYGLEGRVIMDGDAKVAVDW